MQEFHSTATVIMVEPLCRTCEILRNSGYALRAVFPTEVLAAGIYSSVVFGRSTVLANAVSTVSTMIANALIIVSDL